MIRPEANITTKLIGSLILPAAILIFRPLGLDLNQGIVLAVLALALSWWALGIFDRMVPSILLLAVFIAFGKTPLKSVFMFPFSENFVTIILAFLFSQGISKSGIAGKILRPLLNKYADSYHRLVVAMILSAIAFVFIIPQPFSRVIILSSIYLEYFRSIDLSEKAREKLLFGLFLFSIFINMSLRQGEIILNNAVLGFSGVNLTNAEWARYMFVPTICSLLAVALFFLQYSRKESSSFPINAQKEKAAERLLPREKLDAGIIAIVIILWALEGVHHLGGNWIVVTGVICMFISRLLKKEDLRSVKPGLIIFLTAVFSIGPVMTASGTAGILFSRMSRILPSEFSNTYIMTVVLISIACHMILGSNLTTLSVILPGLRILSPTVGHEIPLMFISFIAVSSHFVFPIHNILILLGTGEKRFRERTVLGFSIFLTLTLLLDIFFFYLPWWKLLGLL